MDCVNYVPKNGLNYVPEPMPVNNLQVTPLSELIANV